MAISKSTPYVRYKKDFTSSLHLGTIHIESEYLDRTQKTTIESIHGMTWHNKVVNENKELNLLSDTQLELTELEKQYWNTGEKRVSVDEIHTLEEVEPNEDGTYTYTVNSMEGEYIEIYDGINNITSTSDGLDGQFEIVYDTTEEDINGNIALDSIVPQYEITDSGIGAITSAKSTGLTLVNHITESSKEEVVAIEQQEGQYFTIENTVQGNIKSAILKGQTLVNLWQQCDSHTIAPNSFIAQKGNFKNSTKYMLKYDTQQTNESNYLIVQYYKNGYWVVNEPGYTDISETHFILVTPSSDFNEIRLFYATSFGTETVVLNNIMLIEYQDGMENWDIPYFEGMQSVKMPVLKTTGKNLFDVSNLPQKSTVITPTLTGFILTGYSCGTSKSVSDVFPNLIVGKTYVVSFQVSNLATTSSNNSIGFYNQKTQQLSFYRNNNSFTLTNEMYYERSVILYGVPDELVEFSNIQIEEGITATSYEPFKSNILTCNEEVELRGIGDVKDTLNLMTGEYVQRIGEVVLDGSEDWVVLGGTANVENISTFQLKNTINNSNSEIPSVCDKFGTYISASRLNAIVGEGVAVNSSIVFIRIKKSKLTTENVNGFKQWLSKNPITIKYQLATESVKTVDLTVQNQDGGTIPHIQTQQGITHVSTSSDGLTPVVEMSCSYDTIIKPNTTYTIKLDRPIVSDTMYLQVDLGGTMMMLDADVNAFTIKTPSTLSHSQLRLSGVGNTVKEIIVLEGSRVNDKIEYFEGMKNVENPILVVSNCPHIFGKGGRL